ncbi:MAG: hypothetical protein QOF94_2805, partial [Acidobacteriaceae bacterium]
WKHCVAAVIRSPRVATEAGQLAQRHAKSPDMVGAFLDAKQRHIAYAPCLPVR